MTPSLRFAAPILLATLFAAAGCSGDDDDGTAQGGAGSGGASGGSSGKGGASGSAGSGGASGGSSGKGGSAGGGAGASPVMASCIDYCAATHSVPHMGTCMSESSIADCTEYTCTNRAAGPSGSISDATPACQSAYKAFWDCLTASADPCLSPGGCESLTAALSACAD